MDYQQLKRAIEAKGYAFFDEGDYNLNLIGIRSADRQDNTFNDRYLVAFKVNEQPCVLEFACTTDPGTYYRLNPIAVNGTGILKADQYRGAYAIGKHQGDYPALVQRLPVTLIRDNNRDGVIDFSGQEDHGYFGINHHYANQFRVSEKVDKWSAGCQVFADKHDHDILMALCNKAASIYGNSFTYTLLEVSDL